MKQILIIAALAAVLLIGGSLWSANLAKNDPDVISSGAMHTHPRLTITVKGEQIAIPQNIGVGPQFAGQRGYDPQMQMAAMHTHDDLPVIHLEFMSGPVYREDAMLGQFFKLWGKDMRSFGANMRMTVNGAPNDAYDRYVMRDGDVIELNYD